MNHHRSNDYGHERGYGREDLRGREGGRFGVGRDGGHRFANQGRGRNFGGNRGMSSDWRQYSEGRRAYGERGDYPRNEPQRRDYPGGTSYAEDWPNVSDDYRSGGYAGFAGEDEGGYPGAGAYQSVGGYPGGGYAGGGGLAGGSGYQSGGASWQGDYEHGDFERGQPRGGGYQTGSAYQGGGYQSGGGYQRGGDPRRMQGYGEDYRRSRMGGMGDTSEDYRGSYGAGSAVPRGDDRSSIYGEQHGLGRGYRGLGPKNYTRSDDRIREDICERLAQDDMVDASDISIEVKDGIVTLEGNVEERWQKHRAEDMAESCSGVKDVVNQLRVSAGDRSGGMGMGSAQAGGTGTGAGSSMSGTSGASTRTSSMSSAGAGDGGGTRGASSGTGRGGSSAH